jgi:hypothetical protein
MTTERYKGFLIMTRPYRIALTGLWTADLEIRRAGRRQGFSPAERFATETEANEGCASLAHRIIDGTEPGTTFDLLQSHSMSRRVTMPQARGRSVPPLAGLRRFGVLVVPVVLLLMAFTSGLGRNSGRDQVALQIAGITSLAAVVMFWLTFRRPH